MQAWISLKETIAVFTGIDHDALLILASLLLSVIAALLWRRPLSSLRPWLMVLAIAIANEALTAYADGLVRMSELAPSLRDVLLFMALPSALLLLGRYAPHFLTARGERILVPVQETRPIIDGEFEEIQ